MTPSSFNAEKSNVDYEIVKDDLSEFYGFPPMKKNKTTGKLSMDF